VCLGLDLVGLADLKIEFTLGKPFFPYQQLLGVLPIASKHCLPPPYQELMTATTSPLAGSYPEDFAIDMNGKKNAWEGVVLVPFMDEQALINASQSIADERLTPDERARNCFGHQYSYHFDGQVSIPSYPSSMPGIFDAIRNCAVSCSVVEYDPSVTLQRFQLSPKARLGLGSPARFPTFQSLHHYAEVKHVGVSLFGMGSKYVAMRQFFCLKLAHQTIDRSVL
jgi:5'-3' exoribonuclease 1